MMIRDTSGQDVQIASVSNKKKWRNPAIVMAVVAALAITAWPTVQRWSHSTRSVPLARLRLGAASVGVFERDAAVQGKIVAANSPTLYSSSGGTVSLFVQAGDRVNKGQKLGSIDSPELRNELQREQATLHAMQNEAERAQIDAKQKAFESKKQIDLAQIALTAADREKRRADDPRVHLALSKLEYEKVSDELDKAQVNFNNAQEQYRLLQESLAFDVKSKNANVSRQSLVVANLQRRVDQLQMLSPVDGMVGTLHLVDKTVVIPNSKIVTVVDLSAYAAELDVPESYADDLGIGMHADIDINGQKFPATIAAISPEVQNNLVRCRMLWQHDTPHGLRQNQRVSARILFEQRDQVLTVPRGPFLESGGGRSVYVVKEGLASKRAIKTGASSVSAVEIIEGLNAGEQIIVSSTSEFEGADSVMLND